MRPQVEEIDSINPRTKISASARLIMAQDAISTFSRIDIGYSSQLPSFIGSLLSAPGSPDHVCRCSQSDPYGALQEQSARIIDISQEVMHTVQNAAFQNA